MMTSNNLAEIIGNVDDKLIETYDNFTAKKKRSAIVKWSSIAACFCAVIVAAFIIVPNIISIRSRNITKSGLPKSSVISGSLAVYLYYNKRVYTQGEFFTEKESSVAKSLLGKYLGNANGSINEKSQQNERLTEFASTCKGKVYTVKGYDSNFRLCLVSPAENNSDEESVMFLESLSDISLKTGKDLYGTRLHLKENFVSAQYQLDADWDTNKRIYHAISADMGEFIQELYSSPFVKKSVKINTEQQEVHLYLHMRDGTIFELQLFNDGCVKYHPMHGTVYVQMSGKAFRSVFNACK